MFNKNNWLFGLSVIMFLLFAFDVMTIRTYSLVSAWSFATGCDEVNVDMWRKIALNRGVSSDLVQSIGDSTVDTILRFMPTHCAMIDSNLYIVGVMALFMLWLFLFVSGWRNADLPEVE